VPVALINYVLTLKEVTCALVRVATEWFQNSYVKVSRTSSKVVKEIAPKLPNIAS